MGVVKLADYRHNPVQHQEASSMGYVSIHPVAKTSCEEMTMDYSQLSDFEINKRVAICCGFAPEDCEIAKLGTSIVGVEWDDETGYAIKTVDYCKSPSDAEPIIVENRIGIIPAPENGLWKAAHRKVGSDSTPYHMTQDENPLRAAMITFLMMQDANNA